MIDENDPIEESTDLARVRRAYQIACMNLAELGDQRTRLVTALEGAMMLIDQLLVEMRGKGMEPSAAIISFKAGFDKGMHALLGKTSQTD